MIRPFTKTLLALAGVGALAATAGAQTNTTYTSGDFLMGFRLSGNSATTGNPNTNSVVVDIGPIASFSAPSVYTVNLGSTLSAQYGSGWANDPGVFFSLASTDANDSTNYVTSARYLTGPNAGPAKVWARQNGSSSVGLQNDINALGDELTSVGGGLQPKSNANAYANFMPGGINDAGHATGNIAFGRFNPTTEGNFGQGAANIDLDLIQLVPNVAGADLGFFMLSSDGNTLTYTPALGTSVPEPSTYAALALGVLALVGYQVNKARRSSTNEQIA